MIQRIQTVWLLIAVVLGVVVLSQPLGTFLSAGMEPDATLYNLFLIKDGAYDFTVAALFVLMLLATTLGVIAIFLFKNRKLQMRICSSNVWLSLLWYGALGECWNRMTEDGTTYEPNWWVIFLPLVIAVCYYLAYRGVRHDDNLVRSADRIR